MAEICKIVREAFEEAMRIYEKLLRERGIKIECKAENGKIWGVAIYGEGEIPVMEVCGAYSRNERNGVVIVPAYWQGKPFLAVGYLRRQE